VIVEIALAAHHDDFVLDVARRVRVGQAAHLAWNESGHAGRGTQQQTGRGAGCHDTRLGAGDLRDYLAGAGLQLRHIDAVGRRLGHRGKDLRVKQAAGESRRGALGIDDRADAESVVDAHVFAFAYTAYRNPDRSLTVAAQQAGTLTRARTFVSEPRP
jgi:hypothetical protein